MRYYLYFYTNKYFKYLYYYKTFQYFTNIAFTLIHKHDLLNFTQYSLGLNILLLNFKKFFFLKFFLNSFFTKTLLLKKLKNIFFFLKKKQIYLYAINLNYTHFNIPSLFFLNKYTVLNTFFFKQIIELHLTSIYLNKYYKNKYLSLYISTYNISFNFQKKLINLNYFCLILKQFSLYLSKYLIFTVLKNF